MPLTLQKAYEAYKAAHDEAVAKTAARKESEERTKLAVEEQRAAATKEDNALDTFMRYVKAKANGELE